MVCVCHKTQPNCVPSCWFMDRVGDLFSGPQWKSFNCTVKVSQPTKRRREDTTGCVDQPLPAMRQLRLRVDVWRPAAAAAVEQFCDGFQRHNTYGLLK